MENMLADWLARWTPNRAVLLRGNVSAALGLFWAAIIIIIINNNNKFINLSKGVAEGKSPLY